MQEFGGDAALAVRGGDFKGLDVGDGLAVVLQTTRRWRSRSSDSSSAIQVAASGGDSCCNSAAEAEGRLKAGSRWRRAGNSRDE